MTSTHHSIYDTHFSYFGYLFGLILVSAFVIAPLYLMGVKNRSPFRRSVYNR